MNKCRILIYTLLTILATECRKELIILHDNDIRGKFDEVREDGSFCTSYHRNKGECIGGVIRSVTVIKQHRKLSEIGAIPKVLYLFAGGAYTGSVWFRLHKFNITTEFINLLKPDALALGKSEFAYGLKGLEHYVNNVTSPIVAANIDSSRLPKFAEKIKRSIVLDVQGIKVGIIGYVDRKVNFELGIGLGFASNEIEALLDESENLYNSGVQILLALGHTDSSRDNQIAVESDHLGLLIGGGSRTLLYNGRPPTAKLLPFNKYPSVVHQYYSDKPILVVHTPGDARYLGRLNVTFDDEGNLVKWEGQPIFLSKDIAKDPDAETILKKYSKDVEKLESEIVGTTKVELEGADDVCFHRECNFGNMITDAYLEYVITFHSNYTPYWSQASVAVISGDIIGYSINCEYSKGSISKAVLYDAVLYRSTICMMTLDGGALLRVLEICSQKKSRIFLQFSGIRVVYDERRPVGSRVVSAQIVCRKCISPKYIPLDEKQKYIIILSKYLTLGGSGFLEVKRERTNVQCIGKSDDIIEWYLKRHNPIYTGDEERILFDNESSKEFGLRSNPLVLFTSIYICFCWKVYVQNGSFTSTF